MIKQLIMLFLITLLGTQVFSSSLANTFAEEFETAAVDKYYTSIQIQQGDSLWSIAGKYTENSDLTIAQYVKELKNINGLKEDTIHSGHYLTVMYFTSDMNP